MARALAARSLPTAAEPPPAPQATPLLAVECLSLTRGEKLILDQVSFRLKRGSTVALVGESGAGKSTIALALIGLLTRPQVGLEGSAVFDGRNLVEASERDWLKLRGRKISMIFQDASSALNPCFTVGAQLISPLRRLLGLSRSQARKRAIELLESVGLSDAEGRLDAYPHQLSGGMQQRAMIAIALSTNPELLLADEPTSALDVTIQAQIVRLILDETRKRGASCIFVLHDLALASQACDEIVVLYGGQVAEAGPADVVLREPLHPYTVGLKACALEIGATDLTPLPPGAPSFSSRNPGCRFAPRCSNALDKCASERPPLAETRGRRLACWNPAA